MLVAMSRMPDPRFRESVILILDHGEEGALGLIVNRPLSEVPLTELLSELEIATPATDLQVRLHFGGPVGMNRLFLLHSGDFSSESSETVAPGVRLTMDPEALGLIGRGEGPAEYLLAVGYSGWAAGQLEAEMRQGSWMDVQMRPEWIFADDPSKTWRTIFDKHVTRF